MAIKRLLICTRGEIACRIIRSAKELGITTIVVHSGPDKASLAAQYADVTYDLKEAHASKTYLNKEAIIQAALDTQADAIHPGYGFLSENVEFAKMVEAAGLIFIGPDYQTIKKMGDKSEAINTAIAAGVPVVPGSNGQLNEDELLSIAEKIGFPLLIKASSGGGGKGISLVNSQSELTEKLAMAKREAIASFADDRMYLEKYITKARHIEVQILGDGDNVVHFFERDCSVQRRRQKIWEEAPAVCLPETTRQKMCESAVKLASSVHYRGAGTVEYLYDEDNDEFYFIEMNTRIQVEHPISEQICRVDLIKEMIQIAVGKPLALKQQDIKYNAHAIEVRINAENVYKSFFPCPGKIESINWPKGIGVRVDEGIYSGYQIPPYYDSLIAKLIVTGRNREEALSRLQRALTELSIEGIDTTIPLFTALSNEKVIQSATFHVNWLENWLTGWLAAQNRLTEQTEV